MARCLRARFWVFLAESGENEGRSKPAVARTMMVRCIPVEPIARSTFEGHPVGQVDCSLLKPQKKVGLSGCLSLVPFYGHPQEVRNSFSIIQLHPNGFHASS